MYYYIGILVFIIVITLILKRIYGNEFIKNNKKYLIIITIILTLFLILRDTSVGVDTDNYRKIFEYAHDKTFIELLTYGRHEIGFKYYAKILSCICNNYYFFLAITSILSMIGFYFFSRDNSKNYFATIFIFITFNYYIYSFGLLRQALAISVLLYSIKFIKDRKFWKFLIFVIIASLFHKTALVFLPLYFLYNIKITKKRFIIWLLIIIFMLISKSLILDFILNYIYKPANLSISSGGGYKMLILLIGASITSYYYQDKLILDEKNNQLYINMIFIATLIQVLATYFGIVFRVTIYFSFSLIILVPLILNAINNVKIKRILFVLMYISLFAYYILSINSSPYYVDYTFIISLL